MPIITEREGKGKSYEMPVEAAIGRRVPLLGRVPDGALLLAVLGLSCLLSFGLGFLSGKESGSAQIVIEYPSEAAAQASEIPASSLLAAPAAAGTVQGSAVSSPTPPPAVTGGGEYVASKTGKSYHLPWCAGAKQIKEANKIYFSSKAEAEAAGYAPAKNCKGI